MRAYFAVVTVTAESDHAMRLRKLVPVDPVSRMSIVSASTDDALYVNTRGATNPLAVRSPRRTGVIVGCCVDVPVVIKLTDDTATFDAICSHAPCTQYSPLWP